MIIQSGQRGRLKHEQAAYPEVGPGLGHLQLPVVLPVSEALKTEHLPGVVKAGFVGWNRAWPRGQVLCSAVLLGQKQVPVGRTGVKGQRATVCNDKGRNSTDLLEDLIKAHQPCRLDLFTVFLDFSVCHPGAEHYFIAIFAFSH